MKDAGAPYDFSADLAAYLGFGMRTFSTAALQSDPKWDWGYQHGVYCFVRAGKVVYVGRALGKTLGERLWDQLRSVSDPEWAQVVNDPDGEIVVFTVDADRAYLSASLEAFLIARLAPRFNLRAS